MPGLTLELNEVLVLHRRSVVRGREGVEGVGGEGYNIMGEKKKRMG